MTTAAGPATPPTPSPSVRIADVLPVLPLRGTVVFPLALAPITVGQPRSVQLVEGAMRTSRVIALVSQRIETVEPAGPGDIYRVGTAAVIQKVSRAEGGTLQLVVQGLERIRIFDFLGTDPYLVARIMPMPDRALPSNEAEARRRVVIELFRRLVSLTADLPDEVATAAEGLADARQLAYLIAAVVPIDVATRQEILELDPVDAKLQRVVDVLRREIAVLELGRKIASDTKDRLSKTEREYYLREQLRSIQRELGEDQEVGDANDLRLRVDAAGLSGEALREAERELGRLASIPAASPEHGVIRTYLEWMATLPWNRLTGGTIDVGQAARVLDEDHYGLEKVKERLLEYLAVKKLREERALGDPSLPGTPVPVEAPLVTGAEPAREPILCFVGPPGVGKTSLGQSIARALGRKFVRMSLGGMRDEAEVRGHRRTYIGALPGRVLQSIRRAEARDPVFMLDEIDKVGSDWRGDPSSALLEVLDPAQNDTFVDTYLGVPFDLSQVLFIATANTLDTVPSALRDRMEVLHLSGYTDEEKVRIAVDYLVPKQLAAHGLAFGELTIEPDALRRMVRAYTREAGVRNLDRELAAVARKVARRIAERQVSDQHVTASTLDEFLGRPRFFDEVAERTDRPGVATGLAWTAAGGDILFVEATMMASREERLSLTGMLGDIMRESAQAALSYVRSSGERLGIDPRVFEGKAIHVHVPAGAIPKDGPSAGVAIMCAIASLALGQPVRSDVAMTGEVTLRGKVLQVGGIKEKVLAAHRAGIRRVVLPRHNERDVEDVPAELRNTMQIAYADTAEDVLSLSLSAPPPRSDVAPTPQAR